MNRRQLFFLLLVTALWTVPGAGFAQSGDSSSFGTPWAGTGHTNDHALTV